MYTLVSILPRPLSSLSHRCPNPFSFASCHRSFLSLAVVGPKLTRGPHGCVSFKPCFIFRVHPHAHPFVCSSLTLSLLPDLYSTKPNLTRWFLDPFDPPFVSDNCLFCESLSPSISQVQAQVCHLPCALGSKSAISPSRVNCARGNQIATPISTAQSCNEPRTRLRSTRQASECSISLPPCYVCHMCSTSNAEHRGHLM